MNVGMDGAERPAPNDAKRGYSRHWEHCVRYGYVAAGGGGPTSTPSRNLKLVRNPRLPEGNRIPRIRCCDNSRAAYSIFRTGDGKTLAEALNQPDYNDQRPESDWEYAVGVDWETHFPLSEAKTCRGVFANQNIVCKLTDPATLRFVEERFGLEERRAAE